MKACLQSGRTRVGDLGNLVAIVTIPRPVSATESVSDVDRFSHQRWPALAFTNYGHVSLLIFLMMS